MYGTSEVADLQITCGDIARIGAGPTPAPPDAIVDAGGATLLPGLHDHHIHILALAASLDSLRCGPPNIRTADELASLLYIHNVENTSRWVRGIGYHPSIAGDIDRDWLDRHIGDRPTRIQHRGGRLWVLNSRALQALGVTMDNTPTGLEVVDGRATGRLYEGDQWLRERLYNRFPRLAEASRLLASYGVTGITDATPTNGTAEWDFFRQSQADGQLLQRLRVMGSPQLSACKNSAALQCGEYKIHLLESCLPDLDGLCENIAAAHAHGRAVAIHCVTRTELVFALHALESAGVQPGDRIEHASVTSPEQLCSIADLGLRVVTQPHFIAERGDQYSADVEADDLPWLYRCAGFIAAGVPLAGGSDAPFGDADPWRAMRAAVERKTPSGSILGSGEALTPEQALQLFLSPPDSPGVGVTELTVGSRADLCLLKNPWETVREDLESEQVRCTWRAGELIYDSR